MADIGITSATTSLDTANLLAGKGKLAATLDGAKSKNAERTNQAAQDFEAVYISEMLKPMFETVDVDDTFGGGKGEEVFRGLLVQEMGKSIAKQGGFGLADQVKAELLKTQEHQGSGH